MARAPGELVSEEATAERYGPFSSGQLTAISIVSIVMVWGPLAWAAARGINESTLRARLKVMKIREALARR